MSKHYKLKLGYWIPVVICGVMIACYESGFLVEGALSVDKVLEYYCALVMELITISFIPLALMMFRLRAVKRFTQAKGHKGLDLCRIIRLALLSIPMMVNVYLY